ncbi:MAG: hypothetical protein ABIS47_10560 [Acidimicrobiales bacterium]
MASRSRRWLPVLLVVAVVAGAASRVGAEVDPRGAVGPSAWAASCVGPGPSELVVYGRGWASGPVTLEVQVDGQDIGSTTAPTPSGVFQARVAITVPAGATGATLIASQGQPTARQEIVVGSPCPLTVAAVVSATPCAASGQAVPLDLSVKGAPPSFDQVRHYADLFGTAEAIDRTQPARDSGDYTLRLMVPNRPGRLIPVTVEAREASTGRAFTYATASLTLPPTCAASTTVTTAPATTAAPPATTAPPTTAPPAALGPVTTLPPPPTRPAAGFLTGRPEISVSPTVGQTGQAATVTGRGFAPSALVTLRWRPGIGEWTVAAGGDGSFRTQVLVLPKDVEGPRVLEALGATPASAGYLVVPGSDQPAFGGIFVRG